MSDPLIETFFPDTAPCKGKQISLPGESKGLEYLTMESPEFSFTATMPQRQTRVGFFQGIKNFFEETGGGAIPIPLASKMVKRSPETIRAWVKKGKLRSFRTGATVLVNIHDLEELLDEPVDRGGRPKKDVA